MKKLWDTLKFVIILKKQFLLMSIFSKLSKKIS